MSTKQQAIVAPRAGETYVHCGHVRPGKKFHIWFTDGEFVRPDGSVGVTNWVACCDPCIRMAEGDVGRVPIRGDATWTGDEPLVMDATNPFARPGGRTARSPDTLPPPRTQPPLPGDAGAATFDTAFAWCPRLGVAFKDAARELGTKELVNLVLTNTGPAAAIEIELLKGSFPAKRVVLPGGEAVFVISSASAIRLLRMYCDAGGRFVADHMENRAPLRECWVIIIGPEWVDACAYAGGRPSFFAASDFPGKESDVEPVPEGWVPGG